MSYWLKTEAPEPTFAHVRWFPQLSQWQPLPPLPDGSVLRGAPSFRREPMAAAFVVKCLCLLELPNPALYTLPALTENEVEEVDQRLEEFLLPFPTTNSLSAFLDLRRRIKRERDRSR